MSIQRNSVPLFWKADIFQNHSSDAFVRKPDKAARAGAKGLRFSMRLPRQAIWPNALGLAHSAGYPFSLAATSWFTALGLALPPVAFIT
jgi:hypothetical protein